MLGEMRQELRGVHAVGRGGLRHARVARDVADRIDAGEARHFLGVLRRPSERHQPAAAPSEQHGLRRVAALPRHLVVEPGEQSASVGTAVGFPDIDARDRDAGVEEPLEHPALLRSGQAGQRRRVPDPWLRTAAFRRRRRDDERGVPVDEKGSAGQWQHLHRLGGMGRDESSRRDNPEGQREESEEKAVHGGVSVRGCGSSCSRRRHGPTDFPRGRARPGNAAHGCGRRRSCPPRAARRDRRR